MREGKCGEVERLRGDEGREEMERDRGERGVIQTGN